jgi:hypothetical protein
MDEQIDVVDEVLLVLDIIVILASEENPVLGVVLVGLLKAVTKDRAARIEFILLIIVLNMGMKNNHLYLGNRKENIRPPSYF